MALRLVQPGSGDERDLVLVYHLGSSLDPQVRGAVGPEACVANETGVAYHQWASEGGVLHLPEAIAAAQAQAGAFAVRRLVLVGYSAGCQAVAAHLREGADPAGCVAVDGTHGSVDVWKAYADRARAGERAFVASHAQIVPPGFPSTKTILRQATGFPLEAAGLAGDPAVTREGNLIVYSCEGDQAADHIAQAQVLLPRMLSEAMTLALGGSVPLASSLPSWAAQAWGGDASPWAKVGVAGIGGVAGFLLGRWYAGR